MIKKSRLNNDDNDEQLNYFIKNNMLNNVDWKPVDWPTDYVDLSIEVPESSAELDSIKKSEKKSINYASKYSKYSQPKRNNIYRPVRAQRCLKRGSLCKFYYSFKAVPN